MNVVIVARKQEVYHKYLCVDIAQNNNVVAVLHPMRKSPTRLERFRMSYQHRKRYGWVYYLLMKLTNNRFKKLGWDQDRALKEAQERFFPDAESDYQKYIADLAYDVGDINSSEGIALISSFKPDVVVCSGGPIYRASLISACNLMLNFHTGISPIYNGSYTVYWTFANRHPHLTGGTLMKMNRVVDGGDILAHYLPSVEENDNPATLFMKTIIGGAQLYNCFLKDYSQDKDFVAIPQGRPFHYYYAHQWTISQTITIERYIRNKICKKFIRPEIMSEYWNLDNSETAKQVLEDFLVRLMFDA